MRYVMVAGVIVVVLCVMVRGDISAEIYREACIENKCTIMKPRPLNVPSPLARVVNKTVLSDGSVRTDKGSGALVRCGNRMFVMTAAHIFREGTGEISVTLRDGKTVLARIHDKNETWDVVLLHVLGNIDIEPLGLAAEPATPGTSTIAWGFGPDGRLIGQKGAVVGFVRNSKSGSFETLKTTGRAREGDSGGPVLNDRGEVIGLIWGTDGRFTYSTCSARLRKILEETARPSNSDLYRNEPDYGHRKDDASEETMGKRILMDEDNSWTWFMARLMKPVVTLKDSTCLKTMAALVGVSSPAMLAAYMFMRHLKKRLVRKEQKIGAGSGTSSIALNDDYASQLNALYELSGHSSTADATLGRLYDIKLRDAELSSSGEIAGLAKMLRKQVADQFLRIHSSNPAPAETEK